MPSKKKTKRKFAAATEVRSIARERIGVVKPSRVIIPKSERKSKHKPDPLSEAES